MGPTSDVEGGLSKHEQGEWGRTLESTQVRKGGETTATLGISIRVQTHKPPKPFPPGQSSPFVHNQALNTRPVWRRSSQSKEGESLFCSLRIEKSDLARQSEADTVHVLVRCYRSYQVQRYFILFLQFIPKLCRHTLYSTNIRPITGDGQLNVRGRRLLTQNVPVGYLSQQPPTPAPS